MTPEKIYEMFLTEFPNMKSQIVKWYGRNRKTDLFEKGSIRIVLKTGRTLIFGINRDGSWSLTQ